MANNKNNGTSFVVGVTGHRNLDPECTDLAGEAVSRFLKNLRSRLPDTDIVLLSGLADGADRLAARCALDLGMTVSAVLPMSQTEYERDFSPESVDEFRHLLADDAVTVTELADNVDRDSCYRQLTHSLIRRSNVLLAIWDGVDTGLPGGTSDTLLSYLSDEEDRGSLTLVDTAPVKDIGRDTAFWIPAKRSARSEDRAPDRQKAAYLTGVTRTGIVVMQDDMPTALQEQLSEINRYSVDYRLLRESGKAMTWGLPDIADDIRAADSEGLLDTIEQEFECADALAIHYQAKSDRLFKAFSLVAAALGLLFLTYAKLVASNVFLYGYMVLFTGGFVVFKIAASKRWFAKHIMYRVIAETLRIKFFLRLAGADKLVDVGRVAHQAGIYRFSGFSWINHVFKGANPIVPNTSDDRNFAEQFKEARRLWVGDQSTYFSKKIHAMHHKHHRVERIKSLLLAATVVGIVALILFKYPLMNDIPGTELQFKKLLVFFMGLFPFWLGVWEIYHNKMATKELLWQYRNQADAFVLTEFQLDNVDSLERQRRIFAGLARDALFENYLWTIHRFHREHEPPAAG